MSSDKVASHNFFPPLIWARSYKQETFVRDLFASLIVVAMLVPQALAYAKVAGMPLQVGLYVSILPPLMYCLFGTSMFLAVGTCAIIAILTKAGAGLVAAEGTIDYVLAGSIMALMSGGMLIVAGLLRLGFIANFLSHTVISGFVTGSVLTIAATQFKHLLGITIVTPPGQPQAQTFVEIVTELAPRIKQAHWGTMLLATGSFVAFIFMRRYLKLILQKIGFSAQRAGLFAGLGPFIVVVGAIIISWLLHLDQEGVKVVKDIPSGLPSVALPVFDLGLWKTLFSPALLLAIIVFVESVSVAQAFAVKRKQNIDPNQEMVALGIANMASSISGGYPAAGSFSRSAVNYNGGAETPVAGILAAIGIALVAVFLTRTLYYLPLATLGALIVLAALTLVDYRILGKAWIYSKRDFFAVLVTFVMTMMYGVEKGLETGLILSVVLHIYHTSRPHFAVVGLMPGTQYFRNIHRHKAVTSEKLVSLRVDESLYFANAKYLEEVVVKALHEFPKAKHLVLQCTAVNHIDMSALESLETINRRLMGAGVTLHLSEIKGPVLDRLQRSDILQHLSGKVYTTHYQAVLELAPEMAEEALTRFAQGDVTPNTETLCLTNPQGA
jgi:sulfate permease, SulP family